MADALTLENMSPELLKVAERSRESYQRRSRMVEISKSGSGEGSGWVTGRSYSTAAEGAEKRRMRDEKMQDADE